MKRAIIVLLVIAALGGGAAYYYLMQSAPVIAVNTSPITRGDIVDTVGSTGTLQAVTTVQVGSQVSGNIMELGADFNSIVKKGQIVARLDPSLFQAQLEQTKANLNQARANLARAQSDLERTKVQLLDTQQKYARAKELNARSLVPQSDLDSAKIAVDSAQASLNSQQATVKQTEAAVVQSEASVNQNQVNLDHTIITAPIDGIVTQRSVDVGQTVAASMQAPTLFVIAADLTKMQVSANIDESDIGRIRPGQKVTFRVDAYPTKQFEGVVTQIRLQPVVQSNVTTYGTIISVPNPNLELKPGMTANLKVEIAHKSDVLRIANAAIRFRPTQELFAALNQPAPPEALGGGRGGAGRSGQGRQGGQGGGNGARANAGTAAAPNAAPLTAPAQPTSAAPRATAPPASADQNATPGTTRRRGDGTQGSGGRGQGGGRQSGGEQGGGRFGPGGGDGQGGGRFGQGGGRGGRGFDAAAMMDRFKAMDPDQQLQFIDRMKGRGQDTSAFEAAIAKPGRAGRAGGNAGGTTIVPKYGEAPSAATIDALFPPLPPTVPTPGRVWLYVDKQLKPVTVRLGITDGTNTELASTDLPPNTEVVTNVTGLGTTRPQAGGANTGNPFQQNQRGGGPPGGGFGGPPGGGGGGRGR